MKVKFIIDEKYDKSHPAYNRSPEYFDLLYETNSKYLGLTKDLFQKSWDEINDTFSEYIEKQTGYKWYYDTYECVVSVTMKGESNWGKEPKIMIGWNTSPYFLKRYAAYELILSHYFEIYKRNFSNENLTDGQVWTLAEIAAFDLTTFPNEIKEFWPWIYQGYPNIPGFSELQKKMEKIFLENTFDEYIKQGIELVKNYPNIKPA